ATLDVRNDGRVDLLRAHRDAELVAHVARPLRRAHAQHRPRRLRLPRAADLVHELAARLVPGGLGIYDHAIEVVDDGCGHGMIIACRSSWSPTSSASPAGGRSSPRSLPAPSATPPRKMAA